jgi:hypothetical protein
LDLPVAKLYRITEISQFAIPTNISGLSTLRSFVKSLMLCRGLVINSVNQLKSDSGVENHNRFRVQSCNSPPHHWTIIHSCFFSS